MYVRGVLLDGSGSQHFPKRSQFCKFDLATGRIKSYLILIELKNYITYLLTLTLPKGPSIIYVSM